MIERWGKLLALLSVLTTGLFGLGLDRAYGSTVLTDPILIRYSQGGYGNVATVLRVVAILNTPSQISVPRPTRYNRADVVRYFKEVSRQSLMGLMTDLQNHGVSGVRVIHTYWINASVTLDVTPVGLKYISEHPSVSRIYFNHKYKREPTRTRGVDRPGRRPSPLPDSVTTKYDFVSMGLDKLFSERPQINGSGAVVGVVDSGIDANHPALQGKVLSFYNGQTHATSAPTDFESHGTHVSGTIAGGDRIDNWIGVAPGAKLVVAGALADYDTMIEGMQWFLDVDKNPQVGQLVKAVNCSWNTSDAPDQEVFYRAIAAWEAAGILPVFSAGNSGPNAGSITPPHEYPGAFDVGAYGKDLEVTSFSSRGPGKFHGQLTQKPDITGPGVAITSSVPGGQYESMDGTSMATPHVTGTVALLLQVNPNLNPAQIKQIILQSAIVPNGIVRGQWDPNWGYGRLNAYNAVMIALQMSGQKVQSALSEMGFVTPSDVSKQMLAVASMGVVGGSSDQY